MGLTMPSLRSLEEAGLLAGGRTRMLDFGPQNLYTSTPAEVLGFLRKYARDPDDPRLPELAEDFSVRSYSKDPATLTYFSELLALTNFDYQAIDIFAAPKTRIVDLNFERLPRDLRGRFDLVMNFGTAEHVFNQFGVFRALHEAARVGGHIYNQLPVAGFINHGYYTYHPRFFGDLAAANGYSILKMQYTGAGEATHLDAEPPPNAPDPGPFRATLATLHARAPVVANAVLDVLYRKERDTPFRLRLETTSTLGLPAKRVAKTYGIELPRPPRIGAARWVLKTLGVGNALRAMGLR
jgi:hypothetical protein